MKILSLLFFFLIPAPAFAWQGVLQFAYGSGGTPFDQVVGQSDFDLQAGSGFGGSFGMLFPISDTNPHRFEAQLSAGILFQEAAGGDINWSRYPLEAIYFYRNTEEKFRLGWGVIYSVGNKVEGKEAKSFANADIDNAFGYSLSAEVAAPARNSPEELFFTFGVKYYFIIYNSSSFRREADGNALFLTWTGFFEDLGGREND